MKLREAFDTKIGIDWSIQDNSVWEGEFYVGENGYRIYMEKQDSPTINGKRITNWWVEFELIGVKDRYGITGTGNQMKVFGTVINALITWIKKEQPMIIRFEAKEQSRIKLYDTFVKKYGDKLGYRKGSGKRDSFELFHKSIPKTE